MWNFHPVTLSNDRIRNSNVIAQEYRMTRTSTVTEPRVVKNIFQVFVDTVYGSSLNSQLEQRIL